ATRGGSGGCGKTGTALLDVFTATCVLWSDDNLPLAYRVGFSDAGKDEWFDWSLDPARKLVLPAGATTVVAKVADALGAESEVVQSSATATARRILFGLPEHAHPAEPELEPEHEHPAASGVRGGLLAHPAEPAGPRSSLALATAGGGWE
ncbi:hypothetical protein T484DRAFT_1876795, partial [Baffinella frigidus]